MTWQMDEPREMPVPVHSTVFIHKLKINIYYTKRNGVYGNFLIFHEIIENPAYISRLNPLCKDWMESFSVVCISTTVRLPVAAHFNNHLFDKQLDFQISKKIYIYLPSEIFYTFIIWYAYTFYGPAFIVCVANMLVCMGLHTLLQKTSPWVRSATCEQISSDVVSQLLIRIIIIIIVGCAERGVLINYTLRFM